MMIDILNKVLLFLFFLSILNVIRHGFFLIRNFIDKERFMLEGRTLLFLGMSIAYIFLILIDGVKI